MNRELYLRLCDAIGEEHVLAEEPMSRHTTFRIGGNADFLAMPASAEEAAALMRICREEEVPYYLLGNGSNLLVGDGGYRGVFIQLAKNYSRISKEGRVIRAQAGALLSGIARFAQKEGLAGFEFASGIPGTLGGACVMNAGAYGGELKDVLTEALVLTPEGEQVLLSREQMKFTYRGSVVEEQGYLVLEAALELEEGNPDEIFARMEELREKRTSKQPLDLPSAGSTFKRPAGYFAGKLIMDAGLSGFRVGGACVSPKHCGFVVNDAGASAADVRFLMDEVIRIVRENSGVTLEPEVKMLGEF